MSNSSLLCLFSILSCCNAFIPVAQKLCVGQHGSFLTKSQTIYDGYRKHVSSRITPTAVVEHFEGNPVLLISQVMGIGSVVTSGYVMSANEAEVECVVDTDASQEVDIYRDTPLRYMGYANELGEAFRPLINVQFVLLGYVLALGYVFADAASKALKAPQTYCENFANTKQSPNQCAIPALAEVLTFQLLASVAIPGFTINRWVLFLGLCVEKYDENLAHLPDLVTQWLPTLGGLLLIPLIVKPIDFIVEKFLGATLEPFLEKQYPLCQSKE